MARFVCVPRCGFMVESRERKECVDLAVLHIRRAHPTMRVAREEVAERLHVVVRSGGPEL